MLRRLHREQPESFAFTPDNQAWAEAQISKYPQGRQASAIIPLLWRAQEQEGWLSRPAIEHIAEMLEMAHIRALEVASFYFMFQLSPVGSVAHFQICGTTSCMICGAEDLVAVCREKIADTPHTVSADGKFSWEEVECLGACANAPMAQIGKDYYEDLTAERFAEMIDEFAAGKVPVPGPQNGRYASEPLAGLTTLKEFDSGHTKYNGSVQRAVDLGDTIRRIDGSEVPLAAPWREHGANHQPAPPKVKINESPANPGLNAAKPDRSEGRPADDTGVTKAEAPAKSKANPVSKDEPAGKDKSEKAKPKAAARAEASAEGEGTKPATMDAPRDGGADDLKRIKGVGPKLEKLLHSMGFYHFDQIAAWGPEEVAWVDQNLEGFKGRVSRDDWVVQAQTLADGGTTEFSKKVKKGDV
ncbi:MULTISPECIES: NADH-quinone oxidoreductase subunit E [unclassified Roseovarius]|uniref:NADH-quinone oxidoreductase subunit E n=1 Tax=unclassified Roseovarius TaxID=2614913 RepID=UPI00273EC9BD|nr:NADH-quinone oxidoreductase subunit E [Roseovarius sp. MMSF_3350]